MTDDQFATALQIQGRQPDATEQVGTRQKWEDGENAPVTLQLALTGSQKVGDEGLEPPTLSV